MSGSIDSASTPVTVSVRGGKRDDIVASVQIKESVKDHVFPYAKFLWLDDLPYTAGIQYTELSTNAITVGLGVPIPLGF